MMLDYYANRCHSIALPTHFKYLLAIVLPLNTFLFLTTGPHDIVGSISWTIPFWLILHADWRTPPYKPAQDTLQKSIFYEGVLCFLIFLQWANIFFMLRYVSLLPWESHDDMLISLVNLIAIRFLVGTSSGTSGIVVAHELIHRPETSWRFWGRTLLCSVCYDHFDITHKRGHHPNLGLPDDIATAKLGESFKDYWRRIYVGYFRYAWRSEQERLALSSPLQKWACNQVLHGLLAELALIIFIIFNFGWLAAFLFIYQAIAAVRILETVNYFQHWGLEDGRYGLTFGWVCHSPVSLYALIGLSHHIGHHQDESKHFHEIAYSEQGPVMPYGYFVMNLWVKLANDSYQKRALKELEKFSRLVE